MGNDEGGGGRAGRFAAYLADLASVLGDGRRIAAMISYCTGLLLPSERKSVEPIAALTAPARTAAQHQSLLHFVGQGDWSDDVGVARQYCGQLGKQDNCQVAVSLSIAPIRGDTWPARSTASSSPELVSVVSR